jgi:hypothetical protein
MFISSRVSAVAMFNARLDRNSVPMNGALINLRVGYVKAVWSGLQLTAVPAAVLYRCSYQLGN